MLFNNDCRIAFAFGNIPHKNADRVIFSSSSRKFNVVVVIYFSVDAYFPIDVFFIVYSEPRNFSKSC